MTQFGKRKSNSSLAHNKAQIRRHPIPCDSFLGRLQANLAAAYHRVQPAFEAILPRRVPCAVVALWPQIRACVRAAKFQGNQMIYLAARAGHGLAAVRSIHFALQRGWDVPHGHGVADSA
jgi:hypothetical protein